MATLTQIPHHSSVKNIRPEAEILLCCARTHMNSKNAERLKFLLRENIDWEYLKQTAIEHGVMPLLYWNLNQICPEVVPKSTLDQLQDSFHANTGHNLALTGELLHLLNLLSAQEIPAFPYKGSVLATLAYGNLAFRQWGDLDILVHKKNVLKAKKLLIAQGYRPLYQLSNDEEKAFLKSRYSHPCVRDDDGISVDLHWGITKKHFPFPFDFDCLWQNRKPVFLCEIKVFTPSIEDLFLILCVHASKHRWERLNWICDIAQLIYTFQEINWEILTLKAKSSGSERMFLLGLHLAHHLLDANIPEKLLKKIQQELVIDSLNQEVYSSLFSENIVRFKKSWMIEKSDFYTIESVFLFRVRERLRDRIPYLIYLIGNRWFNSPNEKDRSFFHLPNSLSFVYYALRPIRLFWEYLLQKNLFKHLLGL